MIEATEADRTVIKDRSPFSDTHYQSIVTVFRSCEAMLLSQKISLDERKVLAKIVAQLGEMLTVVESEGVNA